MSGNWDLYLASGTKALQSKDLASAENMFLAALEETEDFQESDPRLAHTLESLAEVYYRMGNYDLAGKYCHRVLEMYERTLGTDHPDVGVLAHNLAMLHHMQCRYMEAEPLYKKAMTIRTKALGSKHPEVMRLLQSYADLLEKTHRQAEAEHLKQCIDGMSTGRWTRSGRWTVFSTTAKLPDSGMAAASVMPREEPNAGTASSEAMAQIRRMASQSHPHAGDHELPAFPPSPARAPAHQDAPAAAAAAAVSAISAGMPMAAQPAVQSKLAPIDPLTNVNPDQYNGTSASMERTQPLPALMSKKQQPLPAVMSKQQPLRPPQPPQPRPALLPPTLAQRPQPVPRHAPTETTDASGAHAENWKSFRGFAEQAQKEGNLVVSEQLWRNALSEAEHLGPLDPRLAFTLDSLSDVLVRQQKYDPAEVFVRRAIDIKVNAVGRDHVAVAHSTSALAKLYYSKSDYRQAVSLAKECVRIHEVTSGPEHPDTACAFYNLALIYHFKNSIVDAEKAYKRALEIRRTTLGEQHPDTVKVQNNYNKLLALKEKDKERSSDQLLISGTWRVLEMPPDAQLWLSEAE